MTYSQRLSSKTRRSPHAESKGIVLGATHLWHVILLIGCLLIALSNETWAEPAPSSSKTLPPFAVILLYHHIDSDTPAITSTKPEEFRAHMDFLATEGFSIWPLPRVVDYLQAHKSLPERVASISFDDNALSVYEQAFPLLKARGWPFTVFVSTDAVDEGHGLQASWEQLREMSAAGASIANHSASHAHLLERLAEETESAWLQRIKNDIQKAQRRIKEETGQQHALFAYPYGEVNSSLADVVSSLGYVGIGQHSGPASADYPGLSLPRFSLSGAYAELEAFKLKMLSLPMPLKKVSYRQTVINDETQPELQLHFKNRPENLQGLRCYGSGQGELLLEWSKPALAIVKATQDLKVGRSRYNCTLGSELTAAGIRRFYWYSQPWIRPTPEGRFLN